MKVQAGLTKESFWDAIAAKYPLACKQFCDWIDEYKKATQFDRLFNSGVYANDNWTEAPKYHELPYAMQLGIFIEYLAYMYHNVDNESYLEIMVQDTDWQADLPGIIDCFFNIQEEHLSQQSTNE